MRPLRCSTTRQPLVALTSQIAFFILGIVVIGAFISLGLAFELADEYDRNYCKKPDIYGAYALSSTPRLSFLEAWSHVARFPHIAA